MRTGIVYTETVVYAAAERFAAEVPFQVAIIELQDEGRITARIVSPDNTRVAIGDRVTEVESSGPIPHFRKS